ncbi:MAG: hypothetical protein WBO77_04225 [Microgenomates group bacterium]
MSAMQTNSVKDAVLARSEKILRDHDSMAALALCLPNNLAFRVRTVQNLPVEYVVSLRIRSVVGVADGGQVAYSDVFELLIRLTESYPKLAPIVRTLPHSAVPFHPHFRLSRDRYLRKIAVWCDPSLYDESQSLGCYVLGICQSLMFHPTFIVERTPYIGNAAAQEWYDRARGQMKSDFFPTDASRVDDARQKVCFRHKVAAIGKDSEVAGRSPAGASNAPGERAHLQVTTAPPIRRRTFKVNEVKTVGTGTRILPSNLMFSDEVAIQTNGSGNRSIRCYLLKDAIDTIFMHIGWGTNSIDNRKEQGGLLVGTIWKDPQSDMDVSLVEFAVRGNTAKGSSAYLEMDHGTWKLMLDEVYELGLTRDDLRVVGWYHTHPGSLDVFMSGTDRGTQSRMFVQDWHIALVLNPQRQIWGAFHGRDATQCAAVVVKMRTSG